MKNFARILVFFCLMIPTGPCKRALTPEQKPVSHPVSSTDEELKDNVKKRQPPAPGETGEK